MKKFFLLGVVALAVMVVGYLYFFLPLAPPASSPSSTPSPAPPPTEVPPPPAALLPAATTPSLADKKSSGLCLAAPTTTAIGSVEYPLAPEYQHLRGLGMVLTAADCGPARLAAMKKNFSYTLVGGLFRLVAPPAAPLSQALRTAGFVCAGKNTASACRVWRLNAAVSLDSLLLLRPFVGNITSEDCAECG